MSTPTPSSFKNYHKVICSRWFMVILAWVYLSVTQCKSLMWFDSGELALAGHSFGLAHPPGQAFYAFLSAMSALSPDPLWCLNQLSALSLALCLYPLSSLYLSINQRASACENNLNQQTPEKKAVANSQVFDPGFTLIALIWVGLYPIWDQGTRIEVYALANLLGFITLALLYQTNSSLKVRRQFWAGIALGLCGATQAIFAIAFALSSGLIIYTWIKTKNVKAFGQYVLGAVLAFSLPHLYIYCVIQYSSGFVWGNWSSWSDVLHYFGGGDYVQNKHAWSYVLQNVLSWLSWFSAFGGLTWLILSFISMLKQKLSLLNFWWFCLFLATGIFPFTYKVYWPEVPDFSAYLLPCLSLSLIFVWTLYDSFLKQSHKTLIICGLGLGIFWNESQVTSRSRAGHNLPLTMAQNWLEALPQDSLLYLESDHWVFPVMYAQKQLGVRPDVLVFNVGFARSSWYWRWLKKQHPNMPSLEQLQQSKDSRTRLATLALSYNNVYTESPNLAHNLSLQSPLLQSPPCPSSWGHNVSCQSALALPTTKLIRSWAQNSAHQDPITQRVLARLGLSVMKSLWSQKKTKEALLFALASINKESTSLQNVLISWWPVPQQVWQAAQIDLIGSPTALEALVNSLGKSNHK